MCTSSGGFFDPAGKQRDLEALEEKTSDPNLWNDQEEAQKVMRERSRLQGSIDEAAWLERGERRMWT